MFANADNRIQDAGLQALVDAIPQSCITSLNLSGACLRFVGLPIALVPHVLRARVCVCVCLSFWARRLRDARSSGAGAGRGNAEQQGQESQLEKFVEYRTHAPALERTERFRFLCGNSLTDHALRCRAMRCYNCPCSQTTKSATWGHWRWLRLCRVAGSPFLTCGVRARDCEKQCRLNGC